jgi:penicillin-binding protein 1C
VIDLRSGSIRALVGSPDFLDLGRKGALNCALRPRSPGSALKPFLFALAYERGLVLPASLVADVPTIYADYDPENFDRRHRGLVSVGEALSLSLNLPAVRILGEVGTDAFLARLRALGFHTLGKPAGHYGLALALGGAEVTLLDLARAYAALANLGESVPVRILADVDPPIAERRRVFAAGAARLVLEDLSSESHLRRLSPDLPPGPRPFIAVKTGTSFGFRDAWAVAVTARESIAVWLGDPRGGSVNGLVASETAAPIALALAEELSRSYGWERPGDGILDAILEEREVCAVTGRLPGPHCPKDRVRAPRGGPPGPRCTLHREVECDVASGLEVCRACRHSRETRRVLVEAWSADVAEWLAQNPGSRGTPAGGARLPVGHDPRCRVLVSEGRPRIVRPAPETEFLCTSGATDRVFLRAVSGQGSRLAWFIDSRFVASAPAAETVAWDPRPGRHEVRCIDDRGRAASVWITVR